MFTPLRRFTAAAFVAALTGLASPASAQNFNMPGVLPGAGLPAMGVMGQAALPALAAMSSSPYGIGSPYGAANPYGAGYGSPYPYYPDIYGGYLRGVADVTQAQGQYQVTIQQARITQAQADMARLDVRRKLGDFERYQRLLMPTPEEVRQADMRSALNRARHEAPLTDVWSASALNDLYRHAANQLSKGGRGPEVPLDEDTLRHVNVTTGVGGNIGVLKDGKLQWPLPLQSADFQNERQRLERDAMQVVQQLKFGNAPEVATLKDMRADLQRLNDALARDAGDLSPSQYIEARRYLNQLEGALRALQDPNVGNYFTQKWAPKGRKVAELVKNMSDQGLQFAPAAPGDEAAYQALYRALNAFDAGLNSK